LVNRYYNQLAALHEALESASEGMNAQSKHFSDLAERLGERLSEGHNSLVQQVRALNDIAGDTAVGPAKPVRYSQGAINWGMEDLDFSQPSKVPEADRLYRLGRPAEAAELYEAAFCVYDELGMATDPAATRIARRWQAAKTVQAAEEYLAGMRTNPDVNVNATKPITEAELAVYKRAPDFKLEKIGTGASEPYWVKVGGKRIGVFKPGSSMGAGAIEAEIVGPRFAKQLGAKAPEAIRTSMPIKMEAEGSFALYKSADGIADPNASDLNRILRSDQVQLSRVTGEGLETYWVLENGKRVGLFVPSEVQVAGEGGVDAVFSRIAKDSGGEAMGAMKQVKMNLPEQEGVFVRFVEGIDLGHDSIPEAQRIIFRKKVARDWALRLILGDYDGHGLNYKISPNGEVFSIDRNLSNILGINEEKLLQILEKKTLLYVIGSDTLSSDPIEAQRQLMKLRLAIMMGSEGNRFEVYKRLQYVHQHLTYNDFAETVSTMKAWDRTYIRNLLGDTFGDQTEAAVDMIKKRIDVLEDVLQSKFTEIPVDLLSSSGMLTPLKHVLYELQLAA
jgi:hypothetical protein